MALLLLAALQDRADAEGQAEVTVAQLAGTLGNISERQVQRHLRDLEASGHITALRKTGGRGRPAQYRLNPGGGSPSPGGGREGDGRGGQGVRSLRDAAPERVTSDVTLSEIETERVTPGVTLSEPNGDIAPERVTPDVTLSPPPPPSPLSALPPFPPTPPNTPIPPFPPSPSSPCTNATRWGASAPVAGSNKKTAEEEPLVLFPELKPAPKVETHPQKLIVARVADVYQLVAVEPPAPQVIGKWVRSIGEEPLLALLQELAAQGHLAEKPVGYVHAAVRARIEERAPRRPAAGPVDRRRLDQAARLAGRGGPA